MSATVDWIVMEGLIPFRKAVRELFGVVDWSVEIYGIRFGSFPRSTRAVKRLKTVLDQKLVIDLRSLEEQTCLELESIVRIPILDGGTPDMAGLMALRSAIQNAPGRELVFFCKYGRNRSALCTTLALIIRQGLSPREAYSIVCQSRRFVRVLPNQLRWLDSLNLIETHQS